MSLTIAVDDLRGLQKEWDAAKAREAALAAELEHELDHFRLQPLPAIIPIPGVTGNTGMGIKMVKKSVEQAVGSDIIFNDND